MGKFDVLERGCKLVGSRRVILYIEGDLYFATTYWLGQWRWETIRPV